MKKTILLIMSSLLLVLTGCTSKGDTEVAQAVTPVGTELLFNGDFSSAMDGWSLGSYEGGNAEGMVENGIMAVNISTGGEAIWHVQFLQGSVSLEKGRKYTVSFDAKASEPREIVSNVGMASDPYTSYSEEQIVSVTTEFQTYSYTFEMTGRSTSSARCEFNLGTAEPDVFLKNISLVIAE